MFRGGGSRTPTRHPQSLLGAVASVSQVVLPLDRWNNPSLPAPLSSHNGVCGRLATPTGKSSQLWLKALALPRFIAQEVPPYGRTERKRPEPQNPPSPLKFGGFGRATPGHRLKAALSFALWPPGAPYGCIQSPSKRASLLSRPRGGNEEPRASRSDPGLSKLATPSMHPWQSVLRVCQASQRGRYEPVVVIENVQRTRVTLP